LSPESKEHTESRESGVLTPESEHPDQQPQVDRTQHPNPSLLPGLERYVLPTDYLSPTPGPWPPTTDHRPPATDHQPPATDHRPPTTDHRPPATGHCPNSQSLPVFHHYQPLGLFNCLNHPDLAGSP
jgi:hypothetical protein